MNEALRAALGYAARGWHVIPIRPGAKVPLTEHGVHDAATDDVTLRSWWSRWPAAALGIACGPSRLLVVDLDGTHAVDAWRTLREQAGDASRPTLTARTGRGWHLYYAAPRITDLGNTAGRVAPGIDTRASGGYVLAPPSLHPNGFRYEWRTPGLPVLEAPGWLVDVLSPRPMPEVPRRPLPGLCPDRSLLGLVETLLRAQPGERNSILHWAGCRAAERSAAGQLDWEAATAALTEAAASVGLDEREAAATLCSSRRAAPA